MSTEIRDFSEVPISGILDELGMQRHVAALAVSCASAGWTHPPDGVAEEIYGTWPPSEKRYAQMRRAAHRIYDADLGLRALQRKTGARTLRLPPDWGLLNIELILAAAGGDPDTPAAPPRAQGRTRKK